jgi:membrane protein required for colicin V production
VNYLDIFLALILIAGLVRGFIKGFVYEVAVLGALFLGVFAALKLSSALAPWLSRTLHLPAAGAGFAAGLLLFLVVVIGIVFLARLFTGLVNMVALGIFNKIAGALFGLAKHLLVLSVLLYFFNQLDTKHHILSPDRKAESTLYYPVLKVAPAVLPVLAELKIELGPRN